MALYREDATGFLVEYASNPGVGYTAIDAMPTDTLENRVNWYREIDLDTQTSEWHPSLQGGYEFPAPPGMAGSGVNIMAYRYSSFEEPDGLPSLYLTNVTATRNATGYNGNYRLSLTATANNGIAYLTPLSNVYNIKLTQNLRWIVSLYCAPATTGEKTFSVLIKTAGSGAVYELPFTTGATAGQWTRVYASLDLRADTSVGAMLGIKIATSGVRIDFDAIMVEEWVGGEVWPSAYFAPTSYFDGSQIVNGSITGTEIANATITADNITNATITGSKIASATITGSNIASATITSSQIANATITAGNIANAAITASQIANLTITSSQIANLTLTGSKIADATITSAKINDLSADKLTAGTINASVITVSNLNASNITGGTLSVDRISANSISGGKITIGGIDTANIASGAVTWATSASAEGWITPTYYNWLTLTSISVPANTNRGTLSLSITANAKNGWLSKYYVNIRVSRSGWTKYASAPSNGCLDSVTLQYADTSAPTTAFSYTIEIYYGKTDPANADDFYRIVGGTFLELKR